jgi:hypothetical protein
MGFGKGRMVRRPFQGGEFMILTPNPLSIASPNGDPNAEYRWERGKRRERVSCAWG